MGLKFKDKASAGDPQPGDIATREILFDLKSNDIYSSTDGIDLIKLGGADGDNGGLAYASDKTYMIDTIVTVSNTLSGGAQTDVQYISNSDNNKGNDPTKDTNGTYWLEYNVVKWIDHDLVFTVGTGGDFITLIDALSFTGKINMTGKAKITLSILPGHVIDYSISFINTSFKGVTITTTTVIEVNITFIFSTTPEALFYFKQCDVPTISGKFKNINFGYDRAFCSYERSIGSIIDSEISGFVIGAWANRSGQISIINTTIAGYSKAKGSCIKASTDGKIYTKNCTISNSKNGIFLIQSVGIVLAITTSNLVNSLNLMSGSKISTDGACVFGTVDDRLLLLTGLSTASIANKSYGRPSSGKDSIYINGSSNCITDGTGYSNNITYDTWTKYGTITKAKY